ncbi:MAG: 4-carboxymuconolactone decarboxylase [Thermoleophilales bacterium]|nr:4-carboxymuconolactone decarboxylase [Thermoleophilales bacterium]
MATNAPETTDQQRDALQGIHDNDEAAIADLVAIRVEEAVESSDLDAKTFALVNLAALIATDGDESSYLLHTGAALDAGASVDEITAVLTAVGPNIGVFRMVAAADPLATALGINLAATAVGGSGGSGGNGGGGGGDAGDASGAGGGAAQGGS